MSASEFGGDDYSELGPLSHWLEDTPQGVTDLKPLSHWLEDLPKEPEEYGVFSHYGEFDLQPNHWNSESPAVDHVQATLPPRPLVDVLLRRPSMLTRDSHVRIPILVWGDEGPIH